MSVPVLLVIFSKFVAENYLIDRIQACWFTVAHGVRRAKMWKSGSAITILDCSVCIGTAVAEPERVSKSRETADTVDTVRHEIVAGFSSEK